MKTSVGTIEVMWGVNRWVRVSARRVEAQRQVANKAQLAELFVEVGLQRVEASEVAAEAWHSRPADAGFSTAHADESMRRSSGLRWWAVLPAVALVIGLVALFFLVFMPTGGPAPPHVP